jgi:hypothetical protein
MRCNQCQIECILYRMIISSGVTVIVERCPECGRNPAVGRPFVSKKGIPDIDNLPLFVDLTKDAQPCEVEGCENKGTELHHFAPRHLFNDCELWPKGWLCKFHHSLWHEKTGTGSYILRRQKPNEYKRHRLRQSLRQSQVAILSLLAKRQKAAGQMGGRGNHGREHAGGLVGHEPRR